jgi:predicted GIY-YIG superfamily endonuclease
MGSTHDLKKRLADHNRGICKTTQAAVPWTIAWYCAFRSKEPALEFERYLKTGSGYAFRKKHCLD